jgi:hypothetical protein
MGLDMKTLLSLFGYVKVPKEAVLLSIQLEDIFKQFISALESPESKKDMLKCLNAQRTLTQFLRSGRLLVK